MLSDTEKIRGCFPPLIILSKHNMSNSINHHHSKAHMASLSYYSFHNTNLYIRNTTRTNATTTISCTMQPSQNNIKVVINGATKDVGRAAILAVTRARGMELAGAVDSRLVGEDAGKVLIVESDQNVHEEIQTQAPASTS